MMNEAEQLIYALGVLDGLQAAKPKLQLGDVMTMMWEGISSREDTPKAPQ